MNRSECRRIAERYKKLSRRTHQWARKCFRSDELDLAIEYEEQAMLFDKLLLTYERRARQRTY